LVSHGRVNSLRIKERPLRAAFCRVSPCNSDFLSKLDVEPGCHSASAVPIRVTNEGNSSLFFGVPDWVYEEEVFSKPSALWWSPDARRIAFLRSDETKVNDYTFPIYNPTDSSFTVTPYTDFVTMKYPKPGFPNPLVTVHVFDLHAYQTQNIVPVRAAAAFTQELTWTGRRSLEDSIIQEMAWVANTTLLVKEISRSADDGSVVICNLAEQQSGQLASGTIVRQLGAHGEEGDKGWIDAVSPRVVSRKMPPNPSHQSQNVYRLPESLGLEEGAYIDMLPTKEGFNQIALFNPAGSTIPQWLTSGQSEVTTLLSVDVQRRVMSVYRSFHAQCTLRWCCFRYFLAAGEGGIGRKLLFVPIPVDSADHPLVSSTALTWDDMPTPSHYAASFSPQAGFYLLSYEGPNVPWQKLIKVDDPSAPN
jgi:dipeptidyl aminopeptidase B